MGPDLDNFLLSRVKELETNDSEKEILVERDCIFVLFLLFVEEDCDREGVRLELE
jgi:hypothetical protein